MNKFFPLIFFILFNLALVGGIVGFNLSENNEKEHLENNCYFVATNCIDNNTNKYEKIVRNRINYTSGNGENETNPELCDMINEKSDLTLDECRDVRPESDWVVLLVIYSVFLLFQAACILPPIVEDLLK